jgi:hypothetical protein
MGSRVSVCFDDERTWTCYHLDDDSTRTKNLSLVRGGLIVLGLEFSPYRDISLWYGLSGRIALAAVLVPQSVADVNSGPVSQFLFSQGVT